MFRTLIAYLFAWLLVVFVAGCSGGSGDQAVTGTPSAVNYIDIEAISGPIVAVRVGELAVLDDSKSYARSTQPMSYSWSFSYKPAASNAVLQDATTATPSFVADVRGIYMLQLVVSAEGVSSQRAITSVVATNPGERPTGSFNHAALGAPSKGLSSNCVNCHHDGFSATIPIKTPNHVASGNACQACHTPEGYAIIPFVDHQEVFGNCSGCHNGVWAIGKSEFHQPTNAECDDCHNTTAFLELEPDGSFDHSNITRVCTSCHNGTVATGKTPTTDDTPPGTHPVTSTECAYCHTTASFLNAYPDHTGPAVVGAGCDSCHVADGSGSAKGQSVGHPITNVDCASCHSIVSFKMPGGIFNHSLLDATVQRCDSCHNASTSINATAATPTVTHQNATEDCGACHNTESFADAIFDHTGIVSDCGLSCHVADGSGTASGMPLETPFYAHMPTNEDCSVCHTPGTFRTGTFDHTGPSFVGTCDSCHDNKHSVGKLPNHIPTDPLLDCDACHFNTTDFAGATFNHSGITGNCASCHDGNISIGKSVGHVQTDLIQTNLDCSSCHITSTFNTFAGTFFHDINIVDNNCASCHNTGIATPKIVNHIPAQTECSVCHDSTSLFSSTTFLSTVHTGITSGCEGCHNGRFSTNSGSLYGKPGNHLPTGQDCDVCHTNDSFTAPTIFAHAGITGNCTSCHNGNYVFAKALGKANDPTPPHPATTSDCGSCHAIGNNFTDGTFDHTGIVSNCASCHGDNPTATPEGPRKNPGHVPTTQDCSFCHVPGTFKPSVFDHTDIVDNCASCHGDNASAAVTKKSVGHVSTTQDCSVCHNTTAFAGARFDHKGIVDNCASCHDGATARGKTPPPDHVPTTQDCNVCHQTTGFIPGTFDHVGIVNNCSSCHNDAFAIGKASASNHVLTNQDCGVCHNTRTFVGAVFDHTGIVDNCASCHDGGTAIGMDAKTNPAHIATALDCHSCHTTASFVGGTWTHDSSSAGNCDQCHSPGGGARSKPSGHLSTTEQCDVCHTTNGWAPTSFRHDSRGNYPGDHRRDPGCNGCHKGSIGAGINSGNYPNQLRYAPFCAGCHANDFDSESDHNGGKSGTVEQNKDCSGGGRGCHKVSDSNFD